MVAEERLQDARHIWINVLFAAKLGAAELPRLISLTSSLENTDSFTVLRSHIDWAHNSHLSWLQLTLKRGVHVRSLVWSFVSFSLSHFSHDNRLKKLWKSIYLRIFIASPFQSSMCLFTIWLSGCFCASIQDQLSMPYFVILPTEILLKFLPALILPSLFEIHYVDHYFYL